MEVIIIDDTNLFLSHKNIDVLFASINVELGYNLTWFESKKLPLNVDKTKWLFCSLTKRQLLPQAQPNLHIDNIHVKKEHVTKRFWRIH